MFCFYQYNLWTRITKKMTPGLAERRSEVFIGEMTYCGTLVMKSWRSSSYWLNSLSVWSCDRGPTWYFCNGCVHCSIPGVNTYIRARLFSFNLWSLRVLAKCIGLLIQNSVLILTKCRPHVDVGKSVNIFHIAHYKVSQNHQCSFLMLFMSFCLYQYSLKISLNIY